MGHFRSYTATTVRLQLAPQVRLHQGMVGLVMPHPS